MVKGINQELFGEDSTKTISKENFLAGFVSRNSSKGGVMTMEQAQQFTQTRMEAIKAKLMESKLLKTKLPELNSLKKTRKKQV